MVTTEVTALLVIAAVGLGIKIKSKLDDKWLENYDRKKIEEPLIRNAQALNPKISRQIEEIHKLQQLEYVNETATFKNVDSSKPSKDFSFIRDNSFNPSEDKFIHGTLWTLDEDGQKHQEDIYLYQPIIYGKNNVKLGPRTSLATKERIIDGRKEKVIDHEYIAANAPYALNESGNIYYGYFPKREVASNMPFDFDHKSLFSFKERCGSISGNSPEEIKNSSKIQNYIQIDLDRDENGNYKVVDMFNREELEKFSEYIKKHEKIDSVEYYQGKLNIAESARRKQVIEQHKKDLLSEISYKALKVTAAKKPTQDEIFGQMSSFIEQHKKLDEIQLKNAKAEYYKNYYDLPISYASDGSPIDNNPGSRKM